MEQEKFTWKPPRSFVNTLKVDSYLVEGFVALLLDIFLLSLLEKVCQIICSAHSLNIIYDKGRKLAIESSAVLFTQGSLVGERWLSRTLGFSLSICSLSIIILSFTINGRSDNLFFESEYKTVIYIPKNSVPLDIDYQNEYKVELNQVEKRPRDISRRLAALSVISRCQRCNYSHCEFLGYAMPNERYDGNLSDPKEEIRQMKSQCITQEEFVADLVSHRYEPKEWTGLSCNVSIRETKASASVPMSDGDIFIGAGKCDMNITMTRCFYRKEENTHCAGVGIDTRTDKRVVFVIMDSEQNPGVQITPSFTRFLDLDKPKMERYLDNIAFMASLGLGDAWQHDLMAMAKLSYDVKLQKRNMIADKINVTDINTRLAYPFIILIFLTSVILLIISVVQWYRFVYRKNRFKFNRFVSVSDFLQLLVMNERPTFNDQGLLKEKVSVVIDNTNPSLTVLPEESTLEYAPAIWVEEEIG